MELSAFNGYLKQLSFADLDEADRGFLDACFPEFARQETVREPFKKFGIETNISSRTAKPVDFGRLRRFSGGPSLGRGRYWSVCHDETGQDGGTLISELMAYWQSSTSYLPEPHDSAYEVETSAGQREVVRILEIAAHRFETRGLVRPRIVHADRVQTALPLKVVKAEIDGVIDLRLPDTQRWFFEHFVAIEEECGKRGTVPSRGQSLATIKTRKISDFAELVPTLVINETGGGALHQAIGAWLRSQQVNGLVYPSARRDAMMTQEGSRLSFDGWNFVDYREAGPPSAGWEELFGLQPQWLQPQAIDVEVLRREEFPGWAIRGAEKRERERYEEHRREFDTAYG